MLKWISFVLGTVIGILMMLGFIYVLSINWPFAIVLMASVGYFVQELLFKKKSIDDEAA